MIVELQGGSETIQACVAFVGAATNSMRREGQMAGSHRVGRMRRLFGQRAPPGRWRPLSCGNDCVPKAFAVAVA